VLVENYKIAVGLAHALQFKALGAKNQFLYFISKGFVI
jgi:hypothetical protein